jgi:maltose/moltooligosaccharide transporter
VPTPLPVTEPAVPVAEDGKLAGKLAGGALLALAAWLLVGEIGLAMRDRAALPAALELISRHTSSDTTISMLLSALPSVLGVVLAPFVGYHSDHWRSRWGRRRPFLFISAPLGAAALLGLAASPLLGALADQWLGGWSPGARLCKLACFCVFWTAFECAAIATGALYTGLVNDVVPPAFLGRFYAAVRVMSLSMGIAFNTWLFALTDAHLAEVLAGIAGVFGAGVVLMCLMVPERSTLGADSVPAARPRSGLYAMSLAHLGPCFRQPLFLWSCGAFMLAGVTFSPFNTFYLYYASSLGISKTALGSIAAWAYSVSIVSAFGIGYLVDKFGAVRMSAIMMALYCAVAVTGCVYVRHGADFRLFYAAHVVISGAYFTAAASMPMALFPRAQFLQFNSTKDVLVALAGVLVSVVQGRALDLSGHDYRLTLVSAAGFSLLSLLCLARVHMARRDCSAELGTGSTK